jgi:hypothetical protein
MKTGDRQGLESCQRDGGGCRVEVFGTPVAVEPLIETGLARHRSTADAGASLRRIRFLAADHLRGSSRRQDHL